MGRLSDYLRRTTGGIVPDAKTDPDSFAQFVKSNVASGALDREQMAALLDADADDDDRDDLAPDAGKQRAEKRRALAAKLRGKQNTTHHVDSNDTSSPEIKEKQTTMSTPLKDSAVQPGDIFGAAAATSPNGQPNVKRASATYDTGLVRKSYPNDAKFKLHAPEKAGRDVSLDGRPVYDLSQAQRAMTGAWLAYRSWVIAGSRNPLAELTDHHKDLFLELVEKAEWVGEFRNPNVPGGREIWATPRKLSALQQKTYLEDSTSGGTNLVPYFFDVDMVTYPLLHGELLPFVDLRDLDISNQVKTPTLANLTTSAGPAEGDSPGITLQTTTSLSTAITSNVYNFTGAITVGRDMLADTPIQLLAAFQDLYNRSLLQFLDKAIAVGDGSTYILGIFNTSSTQTATAKNGTTGPYVVGDIEGMVKALPKQYRGPKDRVIWVAADGSYFRIRGISVSSTDARRIFGYDYDQYMLATRPFKIENDIAGSSLAYGRIDLFRMWRRKGLQLETSTDGKTLMVANEMLLVARSRWAGQVIDPNGWVLMTNAPLH